MRVEIKKLMILVLVVLGIFSCNGDCTEVLDTSDITIKSKLVEIQKGIQKVKTPQDIDTFATSYPKFWKFMLNSEMPEPVLKQQFYRMATDPKRQGLNDEVNKFFPDFVEPKKELDQLFKNITVFFPDFEAPDVNTLISGFGGFTAEDGGDILLIGLEYFMDSTAKYQPHSSEMPKYLKKHYTKETISIKSAMALSGRYLQFDRKDKSLINEMIKFGKILYFVKSVLPCKTEAQVLEFSQKEWDQSIANDHRIYSYFIKNGLYYDTKTEPKRLFVHPRPKCVEISNECPGRIGQWLGYLIVKSYMKKHEITLAELMAEEDHVKIFTKSGYKPGKI